MPKLLREIVEVGGVAAAVVGAGVAFGGVGLLVAGLVVVAVCEVIDR